MTRFLALPLLFVAPVVAELVCHEERSDKSHCHEESEDYCKQHPGTARGTCSSVGYPHCFRQDILSYSEDWFPDSACPFPEGYYPQEHSDWHGGYPCPAPPPPPPTPPAPPPTPPPPCGSDCAACQSICDKDVCEDQVPQINPPWSSCTCGSWNYCVGHCRDACQDHGTSVSDCQSNCDNQFDAEDRKYSCYYGCDTFYKSAAQAVV